MKTRAAIAFEKAKPLEIIEIGLEGPKQARFWLKSRQREFATPTSLPLLVPMIARILKLGNINQGIDLMNKGESICGVVVY